MENETKADEFLGDLANEGISDPFDNKAADILPTGEKEEIQKTETEERKSLPFHEDPKVQRYIAREIAKKMAELQPVGEGEEEPDPTERKKLLETIIGNDTDEKRTAVEQLNKVFQDIETKAERSERLYQAQQQEAQEEAEADDALVTGFENIEDQFSVDITSDDPQARKLRGDFINFIRKVAPKNEDGEVVEFPDLEQTFDIFQSTRQKTVVNRAKDLASRSAERGSSSPTPQQPEDKSWDSVDKIISKLTGR